MAVYVFLVFVLPIYILPILLVVSFVYWLKKISWYRFLVFAVVSVISCVWYINGGEYLDERIEVILSKQAKITLLSDQLPTHFIIFFESNGAKTVQSYKAKHNIEIDSFGKNKNQLNIGHIHKDRSIRWVYTHKYKIEHKENNITNLYHIKGLSSHPSYGILVLFSKNDHFCAERCFTNDISFDNIQDFLEVNKSLDQWMLQ